MKHTGAKKKPAARTKTAKKKITAKSKAGTKKPVVKSKASKKKVAVKGVTAKQRLLKSKRAPKKAAVKTRVLAKKKLGAVRAVAQRAPDEGEILDTIAFSELPIEGHSGGQAGDLQGLSAVEGADSESVKELLEEGNAFEAGVVMGVESADNGDLEEVRTHQVPEDDVPGEYRDSD